MSVHVEAGGQYRGARSEMMKYLPTSAQRILDVGCAVGDFGWAIKLAKPNVQVWGIEQDFFAGGEARSKLDEVLVGSIEEQADLLPDQYFDAIFFNDLLEHLVSPEMVLSELKAKLAPNGVIVASIPNVRYFRNLRQLIFQQDWKYQATGVLDYTHLRFFTQKSIVRLFSEQGMEIIQLEGINASRSWRPFLYNLLFWGQWGRDTLFQQFAVVAQSSS